MTQEIDFIVYSAPMSTVWTIATRSAAARAHIDQYVDVEPWMGTPYRFTTDWRPARALCQQLQDEGFTLVQGDGGLH